jgi:hypothetical protein
MYGLNDVAIEFSFSELEKSPMSSERWESSIQVDITTTHILPCSQEFLKTIPRKNCFCTILVLP